MFNTLAFERANAERRARAAACLEAQRLSTDAVVDLLAIVRSVARDPENHAQDAAREALRDHFIPF